MQEQSIHSNIPTHSIQQNTNIPQYNHLFLYPHRPLISKSKPFPTLHTQTYLHFQQRCSLLVQLCQLIIKTTHQQNSLYVGRQIFLSKNGLIFGMYRGVRQESKGKDKHFCNVMQKGVIYGIIQSYHLVFGHYQAHQLQYNQQQQQEEEGTNNMYQHQQYDCQLLMIHNSTQNLLSYLSQLHDKSQSYYFQAHQHLQHYNKEQKQVSTLQSILLILEASTLFREYYFRGKVCTAILIKNIADNIRNKDIEENMCILQRYIDLGHQQRLLIKILSQKQQQSQQQQQHTQSCQISKIDQIKRQYKQKMLYLFKLLQAQNHLKINTTQSQFITKSQQTNILKLTFTTNLRQLPYQNKTDNQKSSSSLEHNQQTKNKQALEEIEKNKNQICFSIKITWQNYIKVQIEAQSRWLVEQYYFGYLQTLWYKFLNIYLNSQQQQYIPTHKWQLLYRNKNPIISQNFILSPHNSLLTRLLTCIDHIIIVFLGLEQPIKNMYKISTQSWKKYHRMYTQEINNQEYIERLVSNVKRELLEYRKYEETVQEFQKKYLQRK